MPPLKTAILSPGAMGSGMAALLTAQSLPVSTTLAGGRSEATRKRAEAAGMTILASDEALVQQADVVLSIVPPRDAMATAERVANVLRTRPQRLLYVDLNAVSPAQARRVEELFSSMEGVQFVDGGIIGGPPRRVQTNQENENGVGQQWYRPSVVLSGPLSKSLTSGRNADDVSSNRPLPTNPPESSESHDARLAHLFAILNATYVSDEIGKASALKMTFASLTKGLSALAFQSYTTAHSAGVLPELRQHLSTYAPGLFELTDRSVGGGSVVGKAWRWIREMEEIAATMRAEGGWQDSQGSKSAGGGLYDEIAAVYEVVGGAHTTAKEKSSNDPSEWKMNEVLDAVSKQLRSDHEGT